jgi:hypothetical protein
MTGHLARRFLSSLSSRAPDPADATWAESQLLDGEMQLWRRLSVADRRHAITVARRFESMGSWTRDEIAAALLHDIGKLDSDLGTASRVVATVVGPRTARFRSYHDHERIGAEMLAGVGSATATIELVRGQGRAAAALLAADDI